jgi:dolichol-phosphate mannosyltransferase
MKTLLIVPTYNEAENIGVLIPGVLKHGVSVLVVDDNSPDGTSEIVLKLAAAGSGVMLLRRPAKMGLGSAYIDGFRYAIEQGFENVIMMDADLSHPAEKIPDLLGSKADISIGSRYTDGGGIAGWPWYRRLLSKTANAYARFFLKLPFNDITSGFSRLGTGLLKSIDFEMLKGEGYAFLIELKYKAYKKGFTFEELPIIFSERKRGKSKLGKKIIWEAFWLVQRLRSNG